MLLRPHTLRCRKIKASASSGLMEKSLVYFFFELLLCFLFLYFFFCVLVLLSVVLKERNPFKNKIRSINVGLF